ncbi:hypothetical protein FVEN_g12098 [Fusarium venenatum]|uniref:F-box domain-containing protein n=1 Tax=Fusarium venenatum TaxID=56646 RepID=A0A2L2SZ11_9HYPO|nr:uncharacterized protein FVRRES_06744 [Fusarium venenatum]KAG8349710.1 hypothetical protein FVEN_g12098 [Fusarium venenatum]KAH6993719.1 hypothetical protein EDB82DRAFT_555993 [Fusarium venenatum]CEI62308.1 unnamed protein product [Fusarium venenatum]
MDVFAKIPTELVAAILADLPDFKSLHNIVRASPGVYRFLNSPLGVAILDGLLDSWGFSASYGSLTTDGDSRKRHVMITDLGVTCWVPYILRLIALARDFSTENQPADGLKSSILELIAPSKNLEGVPATRTTPPHCVPRIRLKDVLGGRRAFSAHEMLFLIRRLLALSGECFDFFLERIKSASPHHLAEKPSFLAQRPLWGHLPGSQPWGQPYEINAGEEVSWYETQRIILGFCTLQLRYELSNAVYEGRLDWPADDVKAIRHMGKGDPCVPILEKSNIQLSWEPMWAAAIYVAFLKGVPNESSCVGGTHIEHNRLGVFFDTGFQPLKEEHLRLPRPKGENSSLEWPKTVVRQPKAFYSGKVLYPHDEIVMSGSKGSRWAADILCPPRGRRMTEGLLFRPFRRLGFGIWDDERMAHMEMIDDPSAEGNNPRRFRLWGEDQAFTWTSLLSGEEKQELRAYQEVLRLEKKK